MGKKLSAQGIVAVGGAVVYIKTQKLFFRLEVGQAVAAMRKHRGGKSGLRRARCWVMPRGSDPRKVPQKTNRPPATAGKGETVE